MTKGLLVVGGALVTIAGVVFALQGFNLVGGSAMSGQPLWAILGPLIAIAGLITAAAGLRQGRAAGR